MRIRFLTKEEILVVSTVIVFLLIFYNWVSPIEYLSNVEGERTLFKSYPVIIHDGKGNYTYSIKNLYIKTNSESATVNLQLQVSSDVKVDDVTFVVLRPNDLYDLKILDSQPKDLSYSIHTESGLIFSADRQPQLTIFSIEEPVKIVFSGEKNGSYQHVKGKLIDINIDTDIKNVVLDLEFKISNPLSFKDALKKLPFHVPFWSYPIYPLFRYYFSFGLMFPKADKIHIDTLIIDYGGDLQPIIYSIPTVGGEEGLTFGIIGLIKRYTAEPEKPITSRPVNWRDFNLILRSNNWPLSHYKGRLVLGDITTSTMGPSKPEFEGPGILSIYEEFKPIFSLEKFIFSLIFVIIFSIALPKKFKNKKIESVGIMITLFIFIFGLWVEEFNRGIHFNILDLGYLSLLSYLFYKGICLLTSAEQMKNLNKILTSIGIILGTYYIIFSVFKTVYNLNLGESYYNISFNVFLLYLPYAVSSIFSPMLGIITAISKFFILDSFALQTESPWKHLYLFRYFAYVFVPYLLSLMENKKYVKKMKKKLKYGFLVKIIFSMTLLLIFYSIFHLIFVYVNYIEFKDIMYYFRVIIELFLVVVITELNIIILKRFFK